MSVRFLASLISLFVAFSMWGCLELGTTNGGGGAGNMGTTASGTTGSSGANSSSGVGGMGAGAGGSGAGGVSSSSSSGAAGSCDDPGNSCAACEECAGQTMGGECAQAYEVCRANMNCAMVDDCIHACPPGELQCLNGCWSKLTAMGENAYFPYYGCLYCGVCLNNCAMTIPCD